MLKYTGRGGVCVPWDSVAGAGSTSTPHTHIALIFQGLMKKEILPLSHYEKLRKVPTSEKIAVAKGALASVTNSKQPVTNDVTNVAHAVTNNGGLSNAERQRKHRAKDRAAYNAAARDRMRKKRSLGK